jgi:hypothetical protein
MVHVIEPKLSEMGMRVHIARYVSYAVLFGATLRANVLTAKSLGWTREEWLAHAAKEWDTWDVEVTQTDQPTTH